MDKTALLSLVLWTVVVRASQEKYRVNVVIPLTNGSEHHTQVPEGEILTVCVTRLDTSARVVVTVRGGTDPQRNSSLGGIDYTPTEISLVFERSSENQTVCGEFSIIQDGLNEAQETFILTLSQDNGAKVQTNIRVDIDACGQGDLILTESTIEPFSIVEYCKSSKEWVILCDKSNEWTLDDATVVCRQKQRLGNAEVGYHELGNKILNTRGTVPQCYGNESSIDECSGTVANECSPVLVDCGFMVSGDENSGGVLAASVTVPLLLLLAVVCTTAITLLLLWKNGKLHWGLCKLPNNNRNHTGASNSQLQSSSNSRHDRLTEPEAEYTAPFTGPSFSLSPTPVTSTTQVLSSMQQTGMEEPHYEGCDMAILMSQQKPLAKRPIKSQPEVLPKPVKPEQCQEDYSHLHH